jgi:OFA family oxalate/formate antiporter-like MFS transporter
MRRFLLKKYISITAAIIMNICLGGVYAWSFFAHELQADFGYSSTQTNVIFSTTIGLFTFLMIFTGRLYDRYGPRPVALASGIFIGLQYFTASFAGTNFVLMYLAMGIGGALAIANGYVCPIATGVKWFPKNKGFITGLAVAGYGGGAVILTYFAKFLKTQGYSVFKIFRITGAIYSPLIIICALLLFVPKNTKKPEIKPIIPELKNLFKSKDFWAIASGMFFATIPGLIFISNLKLIGTAGKISPAAATLGISLLALGNAAGRILWGFISDLISHKLTALLSFGLILTTTLLLPLAWNNDAAFVVEAIMLGFSYGSCFSIYPALTSDKFGADRIGSIYPVAMFFHGIAALIGPSIAGFTRDSFGNYTPAVIIAAGSALIGMIVFSILFKKSKFDI